MRNNAWNDLLSMINGSKPDYTPAGFIIDSPWIPEWYGITVLDYFTSDELWLKANLKAVNEFPEAWFMPGFWSEYGMCTEPSAFGAKIVFPENSLPHPSKVISRLADADTIPQPNVKTDGLLPFMINRLRKCHSKIRDAGHEIRFAVSRGPFNIASFLMGTTEFMMALAYEPDGSHKLLNKVTDFVCDWLSWQRECFPAIDGILILDDIIGFVGENEFREFVFPCFKRIFSGTGTSIRFLHNDAEGLITAGHLNEIGVNMFNFSFNHSFPQIRELAGDGVLLVGNIPPRDVMAAGTPADVYKAVTASFKDAAGDKMIIWSVGGGMPPGVSSENIRAFIKAVNQNT